MCTQYVNTSFELHSNFSWNQYALDLKTQLNAQLKPVNIWMTTNPLTLNSKKTAVMYFGTRQIVSNVGKLNVQMVESYITIVDTMKYLGMMSDRTLAIASHLLLHTCAFAMTCMRMPPLLMYRDVPCSKLYIYCIFIILCKYLFIRWSFGVSHFSHSFT